MRLFSYTCIVIVTLLLSAGKASGQQSELSPYYAKLQYAGSIGLASVGIGRTLFSEKLDTDVFVGYLPERVGGEELWTAAVKANFVPIKPVAIGVADWQPLRTGVMLSYTFGEDYFVFGHHDKYPKGYYGHPTSMHLYLLLGGQVDFNRSPKMRRLGLYYEFNSSAEYLISYVRNTQYLTPGKVFNLALGMRVRL